MLDRFVVAADAAKQTERYVRPTAGCWPSLKWDDDGREPLRGYGFSEKGLWKSADARHLRQWVEPRQGMMR